MIFERIAIAKLQLFLDKGYTISKIEFDATVSEVDGQFSVLTVVVTGQGGTGKLDSFGRVTWDDD